MLSADKNRTIHCVSVRVGRGLGLPMGWVGLGLGWKMTCHGLGWVEFLKCNFLNSNFKFKLIFMKSIKLSVKWKHNRVAIVKLATLLV